MAALDAIENSEMSKSLNGIVLLNAEAAEKGECT